MEINPYLLAILFGFFAGLAAIGITLLIEKFGGVIGGTLGTSPTTIIPASIGIIIQADYEHFANAMYTVPLGMLANTGFLYCWKKIPHHLPQHYSLKTRLILMIIISLSFWAIAATLIVVVFAGVIAQKAHIPMYFIAIAAFVIQMVWGSLSAYFETVPAPKGKNKVAIPTLLFRGLFAGSAIFVSLMLSKINGFAAGLASTFPAIFLTTMVSVWWSQGEAVSSGAVGPMMLGGLSVGFYTIMYATVITHIGPFAGFAVSYIGAILCCSIPIMLTMRRCGQRSTKVDVEKHEEEQELVDVPLDETSMTEDMHE